jgi:hypothetical protein
MHAVSFGDLYADEEQPRGRRATKAALDKSGRFRRPIVTEITPAPPLARRGVSPTLSGEEARVLPFESLVTRCTKGP